MDIEYVNFLALAVAIGNIHCNFHQIQLQLGNNYQRANMTMSTATS